VKIGNAEGFAYEEFCGKYVFGVPLGEAFGVVCFSCASPDVLDPSFATPSPSVGNWLAGCRSQASKASEKVAISTKYFFINFRNLSTQRSQRKDSQNKSGRCAYNTHSGR
jgi:hypothetical protein